MKQNRFIKLLATGAVSAIALTTAFAQTSSTTTTDPAVPATSSSSPTPSTSTVEGSGTITSYTPGDNFILLRPETSIAPVMYYTTKTTTIVDPAGKAVQWSALKAHTPVKYTYVNDGDRLVISKITLTKSVSSDKKKEKTTTTKP